MARNKITNQKKIDKFSALIGRTVVIALTRGGTNHRIDVGCIDGTAWSIYINNEIKFIGEYKDGEIYSIL